MNTWPCPDCNGTGTVYTRHGPTGTFATDWDMDRCDRCHGLGTLPWNELTMPERSRWHEQWEAQVREVEDNDSIRYYMGFAEYRTAWNERDDKALNDGVVISRETHLIPVMASTVPRQEPPWIALCGARCVDSIHAADGSLVRFSLHWTATGSYASPVRPSGPSGS